MVSLIREAYQQGQLFRLTRTDEVNNVLDEVMSKSWSNYIKPYIEDPQTVVKYLSRYTYRIAISNYRIIKMDKQSVYFHWKDYADNNRKKIMKLDGVEFLRRFLMHVLPSGFMRIRHFGFLASCIRRVRIERLRKLLTRAGIWVTVVQKVKQPEFKKTACFCPSCHQDTMKTLYQMTSFKYRRRSIA